MDRLDGLLAAAVHGPDSTRVPGVAAAVVRSHGVEYSGAAGVRALGGAEPDGAAPMTTDTVIALYSASKPLTGTAVLQCVDDGLLDLDAPAAEYVPEIGEIEVLDGFDADGAPLTRSVSTPITTRMLLLHTAGFAYPFFDADYQRLVKDGRYPDPVTAQKASLTTPILFEPGTRWNYGTSMDWAGLVVEAVRGARLEQMLRDRVFAPLGMASSGFVLTDDMESRRATVHLRRGDALKSTRIVMPQQPEVQMGGQGLYSTVDDYARFLQMWLRDGVGDNGRVLSAETVAWAARNGLADGVHVTKLHGVDPVVTHDAEFFPGQSKSWAYTFLVNDEAAPTGRSAGSLGWAGLANIYFWIDRTADVAGVWGTQVLPFADPAAMAAALEFETRVYREMA
ncbi:serine hydrolase domain-containing protein [Gordonia phthalatica]|uniref:1,4-butanediol diacrylate esterase n=1 Tax=Gordonia phthalatica TaxID=1136941 RepID=A0A0N9NAZ7_9ACTN|nr:serine hydrolase domain-containing protein [Gordonia phthalatica]ALG85561.1 1,4-butanediol diacrylate esterase [Gordonia phthalatica]